MVVAVDSMEPEPAVVAVAGYSVVHSNHIVVGGVVQHIQGRTVVGLIGCEMGIFETVR